MVIEMCVFLMHFSIVAMLHTHKGSQLVAGTSIDSPGLQHIEKYYS